MLKIRLIPSLLLKDGRCVKTVRFAEMRDVGNPVTAAKVYDAQRADELVFLDISASSEGRDILLDIVSTTAAECFMPLTVGGGVRTVEDIRKLLNAGADKVAINTQALKRPEFIREAAQRFGNQCILVSMDVKRASSGQYEVWANRAQEATGIGALDWAKRMCEYGAGEILLASADRDGTMQGYDLDLVRAVADCVDIPVIASGGVGTLQHLVDGITKGHASAVSAASIFHFTDQSIIKARSYMKQAGLDVRLA